MPELSGLQVAKEVARLRPDLPVVISSGFLDNDLRQQIREAGVSHILPKPYSLDELACLVQTLTTSRNPGPV